MSVALSVSERPLVIQPATAEALAPFGQILGRNAGIQPIGASYYGKSVATSRPVNYVCEGTTELSLSTLNPREGRVRYLERHFQHTQTFIPLAGKGFVLVMAPPNEDELPDLDAVAAFYFDGTAGFAMAIGTWHEFPFPLEPDTDVAVVLSSQTYVDLRNKTEDSQEAFGPDLQKLDIRRRTGTEFTLDLDSLRSGG